MTASAAFIYFLASLFLLLCVAWLLHSKFIDWSHHYTRDNTALDELAFRELFFQNMMWTLFTFLLMFALYFAAVFSNPYLSKYWVHLVRYFYMVIYEICHGIHFV